MSKEIPLYVLKLELNEMINEVGDLENIEPYPFQNNEFKTEEGWKVKVKLEPVEEKYCKLLGLPYTEKQVLNVGYSVEGKQDQHKKSTFHSLIRILKTISVILIEYIENNSKIKALLFIAANKDPNNLSTDSQKEKLYKAIILDQLAKLKQGWSLTELEIDSSYKGYAITRA